MVMMESKAIKFTKTQLWEINDLGGADLIAEKGRVTDWLKKTRKNAITREYGPSDRASDGVKAIAGGGGENALLSGEGDSRRGVERTDGEVSDDSEWTHKQLLISVYHRCDVISEWTQIKLSQCDVSDLATNETDSWTRCGFSESGWVCVWIWPKYHWVLDVHGWSGSVFEFGGWVI